MKKILTILAAVLTAATATAQRPTWTHRVEPQGEGIYRIVLEAQIPARYHMYDMGPYASDGPTATTVALTPGAGVTLEGDVKLLTPPHRYHDEMFDMEIGTLEGQAVFEQRIRLAGEKGTVEAALEWMLCDDRSCTPPDELQLTIRIPQNGPETTASEAASGAASETTDTNDAEEVSEATNTPAKDAAGDKGMWALIIEAVLWGFAALLTPCVFPMVPMTVSYFLKGEGGPALGRLRAALYGLFIVALYTLPIAAIILITRAAGGDAVTADIFNWLATHWLPNVIFFAVFMVFAASFFGAFEITMPSWLVNKADAKADTKGWGGIFFLALTLVLVSFSCTGPIVGSVLIKSTSGEFWAPILTMMAFSLAFALPFTLFALFPSILKKLPKSGGWLNSVKIVIGFVEVALGFKFLSVADQTYHWGLLDREIYLAIWIAVFTLLGLYLLGKLKFAHDNNVPYIGVGRLALATAVFAFVIYMVPGMWGAPLKGLSGYLPPLTTQDFVLTPGNAGPATPETAAPQKRKYADFLHLPHGLEGFFDLAEAEAYAARVGKPLFIDFTGHGCVNCREMESRVWSDPEVLEILRNDYVIVALYSDDKKQLPENEWVTTDGGKVLKSLGKINSYLARKTYGVNAQPCYILQGRDGKLLAPPRGYDLDVAGFVEFLRAGLEAYAAQR